MPERLAAHRVPFGMLLVALMTLAMGSVHVVADMAAACAHDGASRFCGGSPKEMAFSYTEDFKGEGVAAVPQKQQVEREAAPLPARQEGIELVSKLRLQDRNGGLVGRIADVTGHGNFAYLTAFRHPSCERGGVHVVDIANPAKPRELVGAFIPTSRGSYAGEGIKVRSLDNEHFKGDVLIFQNESCGTPKSKESSGGISLWDVSRPNNPKLLSAHQGDFTVFGQERPFPNQVHSFEVWTDHRTNRTYAALVDNEEWTDVDIMDITDPRKPVLINDTLDLFDATYQDFPAGLTSVFSHDMDVKRVGERYIMTLNYWDGGYVLLDVTDPTVEGGLILAETDYAEFDEQALERRGERVPPVGSAHQSELSKNNDFLIGTDEHFDPYLTSAKIVGGAADGQEFAAVSGGGTPPVDPAVGLSGKLTFVGFGCNGDAIPPASADSKIALVERGPAGAAACAFQEKFDNIKAAGYAAGIVMNNERPDCLTYVSMLVDGDQPFLFVNRTTGLRLLGLNVTDAAACQTATPSGAQAVSINIASAFRGWGYVRLFSADVGNGMPGSGRLTQVDTYAIDESQDPAFAQGFGDLSVHEVAMDKKRNDIAYLSYYAGGVRVVQFGAGGITEIGAFVDKGGSNFWGVEIHEVKGQDYLLASDRDFGLYIFNTVNP